MVPFRIGSVVSSLLLALICAVPVRSAVVLDRVVAVVNQEAITWSELYSEMEFELARSLSGLSQEQKMQFFREREEDFLEAMIDKRLQLQTARAEGITVRPEEVDRAVESIRAKFGLTEEEFKEALHREGFTPHRYRRQLTARLLIGRLVERQVREKVSVSDEDVERYLTRVGGRDDVRYHLSQIFLPVSDEEDFGKAEQAMREVSEHLAAGEDFTDVAVQFSRGPAAAAGGDMGVVARQSLSPEFQDALEGMKPGDVSAPFRTRRGLHVIRLEEVSDVREVVREELYQRHYRSWLRGLRERSFIDVRL
jgi:peptidyl-prolyl cis-trans isomerase SurA